MNGNDARIPYYVQVAETLRRRIMTDEYMEESLIPSVPELEKEFNVSNITSGKPSKRSPRMDCSVEKEGSEQLYRNVNGTSLSLSSPVISDVLSDLLKTFPLNWKSSK